MKVDKSDLNSNLYENLNVLSLGKTTDIFFYRSKDKKSIGFNIDISESVADFYQNIFKLDNPKTFKEKLKQAVSGDGKELNKINALHSSSLCALLMFYNVSDKTPFSIKIGDDIHTYTKVYFEVKNKVISRPSNMDVVLVNEEKGEILFIECKFSEYLSHSKKYKLPKGYVNNYNNYFIKIGFDKMEVFPEGIKQLVAHYIGIKNFKNGNYSEKELASFYPDEKDSRKELYNKKYNNIAFMEVIFELPNDEYNTYRKETEKVFDLFEKENEITILHTQKYQDLFKGENLNILSDKVKDFYKLPKN